MSQASTTSTVSNSNVSNLSVSNDLLLFAVNTISLKNLNIKAWESCTAIPELLLSASTFHVLKCGSVVYFHTLSERAHHGATSDSFAHTVIEP